MRVTTGAVMLAVVGWLAMPGVARAGWYIGPAVKWSLFSARPMDAEPTPNYYGYGGSLSLGYSARQMFDMGIFGQYLPGHRKDAGTSGEDASLATWGAELALRIREQVYLGLRGGSSEYRLYQVTDEKDVDAPYEGVAGGLALGAVAKTSKSAFFHTTFEFMHHIMKNPDDPGAGHRRFDSFCVSVSFMFNSYNSHLIENTIFKDFLDTLLF